MTFDESQHPRDAQGRWTEKGGGPLREKFEGLGGYAVDVRGENVVIESGKQRSVQPLARPSGKVAPSTADQLRRMGKNPSDYMQLGSQVIRRDAAQHVIRHFENLEVNRRMAEEARKSELAKHAPGLDLLVSRARAESEYYERTRRAIEHEGHFPPKLEGQTYE